MKWAEWVNRISGKKGAKRWPGTRCRRRRIRPTPRTGRSSHAPDLEKKGDPEEGQEDRGDDQAFPAEPGFVERGRARLFHVGQRLVPLAELFPDLFEGQPVDEVLGRDEDRVHFLKSECRLADLDALLLGDRPGSPPSLWIRPSKPSRRVLSSPAAA